MSSMMNLHNINGIPLNRAIAFAPAIMETAAHTSRSAQYKQITTLDVLLALDKQGFSITHVAKQRVRDSAKKGFEKHQLRLRHLGDSLSSAPAVGKLTNEIILTNSHDGSSSFQLRAGLYRFVCSNGLVIAAGDESRISVRHSGDNILDNVIEGTYSVLERSQRGIIMANEWDGVQMTRDDRMAFAEAALIAHYGKDEHKPVTAEQLLTVRRTEDKRPSLFNVYNVVQENIVKGGLYGRDVKNHSRKTRAVAGIDTSNKVNEALWSLGEYFAQHKARIAA